MHVYRRVVPQFPTHSDRIQSRLLFLSHCKSYIFFLLPYEIIAVAKLYTVVQKCVHAFVTILLREDRGF